MILSRSRTFGSLTMLQLYEPITRLLGRHRNINTNHNFYKSHRSHDINLTGVTIQNQLFDFSGGGHDDQIKRLFDFSGGGHDDQIEQLFDFSGGGHDDQNKRLFDFSSSRDSRGPKR